jgi:hypothetical protein
MKRMLPNGTEMAILGTIAVICAAMLADGQNAAILPIVVFPMILTAMLMGAKRTGQLSTVREQVVRPNVTAEKVEQSA